MKKFFTLIAAAAIALGAQAYDESVLIDSLETYSAGDILSAENSQVTLGSEDTYSVKAISSLPDPFFAYISGSANPKDDNSSGYSVSKQNVPTNGCYFVIETSVAGTITAGVIINSGKSFYVTDGDGVIVSDITLADADGTEYELDDSYQLSSKLYGTVTFEAEANVSYYLFTSGSKLGFGGYTLTYASEDDTALAEAVEGDYTVYTEVLFAYISSAMGYAYDTVSITANEDGTVDVSFSNDTWGEYSVESATVTENEDGSYSITGTGTATISYHGSTASEYECELDATIEDGVLTSCVFSMEFMGGTTVTCVEGLAPAYAIADDYICNSSVVFAYGSYTYESDTISIAYTSATTIELTYTNSTWGEFVVSDVEVSVADDGSYSMTGSGTVSMSMGSSAASDYAFDFEGTMSEDLSDYTFTFTLEIMGTTTVTLTPYVASEDETDGISSVKNSDAEDGAVYNLAGKKVDASYKGIVIKNGKKVIQK